MIPKITKKPDKNIALIRKEIAAIKKRLANTATKDDLKKYLNRADYFQSFDQIMSELKAIREENVVLADMKRQVNQHEDRLETVETKLGIAL